MINENPTNRDQHELSDSTAKLFLRSDGQDARSVAGYPYLNKDATSEDLVNMFMTMNTELYMPKSSRSLKSQIATNSVLARHYDLKTGYVQLSLTKMDRDVGISPTSIKKVIEHMLTTGLWAKLPHSHVRPARYYPLMIEGVADRYEQDLRDDQDKVKQAENFYANLNKSQGDFPWTSIVGTYAQNPETQRRIDDILLVDTLINARFKEYGMTTELLTILTEKVVEALEHSERFGYKIHTHQFVQLVFSFSHADLYPTTDGEPVW